MLNESIINKAKKTWFKHDTKIVFAIILIIFFFYSIFIAFNIKKGIINDEITHFDFSKQFSTTMSIPPELSDAYNYGTYITQRPFLFYWINGRIINMAQKISTSLSNWQLLMILRVVNVFYALGTVFFCYLFAKEFITHKWWRLLPPFLLSNTIMFVFLSGGVTYDNLTNLLCISSLFFLARVFNHRTFLPNSLTWMICIAFGGLTKYTVLPLALVMGIVWIIFFIKNRKQILPVKFFRGKTISLSIILLLLIIGNLSIYGYNLFVYHSLLPKCEDILTKEQCQFDFYNLQKEKFGMEGKLTILESIKLGYPNPVKYFIFWSARIINNIFGIGSHKSYQTFYRLFSHLILIMWVFSIALLKKINFNIKISSFIGIFLGYFFTVFIYNYNQELSSGFAYFAIHGRYIFPVIGIFFMAFTKGIMKIPHIIIRKLTLIIALLLYFLTGPLTFIYRYHAVFTDWFVR